MCNQKYRIRVIHRLNLEWRRLCSCQVINNACELVMLFVTLAMTILAFSMVDMKVGARVCTVGEACDVWLVWLHGVVWRRMSTCPQERVSATDDLFPAVVARPVPRFMKAAGCTCAAYPRICPEAVL